MSWQTALLFCPSENEPDRLIQHGITEVQPRNTCFQKPSLDLSIRKLGGLFFVKRDHLDHLITRGRTRASVDF